VRTSALLYQRASEAALFAAAAASVFTPLSIETGSPHLHPLQPSSATASHQSHRHGSAARDHLSPKEEEEERSFNKRRDHAGRERLRVYLACVSLAARWRRREARRLLGAALGTRIHCLGFTV
jgi:hypothetical protein